MWHERAERERPVRRGVLLVRGELRKGSFVVGGLSGWDEDRVVAEATVPAGGAGDVARVAAHLGDLAPVGHDEGGRAEEGSGPVLVPDVAELRKEQLEVGEVALSRRTTGR